MSAAAERRAAVAPWERWHVGYVAAGFRLRQGAWGIFPDGDNTSSVASVDDENIARLIAEAPAMASELLDASRESHAAAVKTGDHIAKTFEECGAAPCYRRALILERAGLL